MPQLVSVPCYPQYAPVFVEMHSASRHRYGRLARYGARPTTGETVTPRRASSLTEKPPDYRGFPCERYWDRTSDLFRVREARYRCANRSSFFFYSISARFIFEVATGFEPVWTALQAAASPLGHATMCGSPYCPNIQPPWNFTRADDEIRTRDPHLGKVMRYHCATSALHAFLRAWKTLSDAAGESQSRLECVAEPRPFRSHSGAAGGRVSEQARGYGRIVHGGRLAQLVARFLHTEEVIGSSPVSPTTRSPAVAAEVPPLQGALCRASSAGCCRSRSRCAGRSDGSVLRNSPAARSPGCN